MSELWQAVDDIRADQRVLLTAVTRLETLLVERWASQVDKCGLHNSQLLQTIQRVEALEARMDSQYPSCPDLDMRLRSLEVRMWMAMGGAATVGAVLPAVLKFLIAR